MFIKKIWEKLIGQIDDIEFNEDLHKICPECDGTGVDYPSNCETCKGRGFVEKTYKERYFPEH